MGLRSSGIRCSPILWQRWGLLRGSVEQVRARQGVLHVWAQGQRLLSVALRPRSGEVVTHPDQFRTVAPASPLRLASEPLGHQVAAPAVARRPLVEYDQLTQGEAEP